MTVYESDVIKGLGFTSEESQKEFDRLLSSKEAINKFMISYNASFEDFERYREFIYFVNDDGKIVVKFRTLEELKENYNIVSEFDIDNLYDYFGGRGGVLDNLTDDCFDDDSFDEEMLSILNKNLDENLLYEGICQEIKSNLVTTN